MNRAIGRRLREARIRRGMSQQDLAKMFGITFQAIHKYETAKSAITAVRLARLADILEMPIGYFYADGK